MTVEQLSPFDIPEGRQHMFSQMIGEVELVRTRIQETIRDQTDRETGLLACDRLIHRYQSAIDDWSALNQQNLSIAEDQYLETREILFSE